MHYVLQTCWIRLEALLTRTVYLSDTSPKRLACRYLCKTSWRRLETSGRCLEVISSRRLEDVLMTPWRHLAKTSWRCLEDVFKTSSKRLEEVLKMSWKRFCKTSWRCLKNVLKTSRRRMATSSKRLEKVLKMSWKRFCKTSWRCLKNVLKTSRRRMAKTNILVSTKTSSRRLHQDEFLMGMLFH